VAGYPERVIPITPVRPGAKSTIAADGMRASDGYMVDAKYVKNNGKNCYRVLDTLQVEREYKADGSVKWNRSDHLAEKDRSEMAEYAQAVRQHDEIRGLEIDTNYSQSVAYWETLMGENHVTGVARYVP
jgi:hypothetical protein